MITNMQIKDLAIGDGYVYLMEGGTKVKFYVLAHNYESGLNGMGRTMFCRERPNTTGIWANIYYAAPYQPAGKNLHVSIGWGDSRSVTISFNNIRLVECALYDYLVNTYPSNFTDTVKGWIGTTKYDAWYSSKNAGSRHNSKTFSTPFFTVSAPETLTSYSNDSGCGSLLTEVARNRLKIILSEYGSSVYTRSQSKTKSATDDNDNNYYAYGVYIDSSFSPGNAGTKECGYLPCFTLPETLYIDKDGFVVENQPPEVTSDAGESGAALGEKNEPFALPYTVTDSDGDPMTITEKVNGVALAVLENVATGTELTVQCLSEKALFQQILNGENTLTLEADDGKTTTEWTATFTKNVTRAVLSLAQPLTADDTITAAALTLEGSFPADMSLTVEMTNNALDDAPVWETVTDIQSGESRAFVHHAFANKTAARGFAFNYKVTISRGESGVGGIITMIGGAIG